MEIEVYADLLFLINAGMDGLCFCLTGRILHRKLSWWRVILGSVLGGVYAVLALFPEFGQLYALLCDIAVCIILCTVVFFQQQSGGGQLCLSIAVYIVLSMILGGVMTALYHLFNRIGLFHTLPNSDEGLGTWLFVLFAFVGSIITLYGGGLLSRSSAVGSCRVRIELEGKEVELNGMIDTGNLLRDPLSGHLVICADHKLLSALLSPGLALAISDSQNISSLSSRDAKKLRLIPASSATGRGMLVGFVPDRILLSYTQKNKAYEKNVCAIIAATELTTTQALIPAELLN